MARAKPFEEADEGYFASISDLMVGILFVFLLMLTVLALNFRAAEEKQTIELAKYERLQGELEAQKRLAEKAVAAAQEREVENARLRQLLDNAVAQLERDIADRQNRRTELLASLKRTLTERGIAVTVDERSGVLRLAGDVLFRTGSADLETDRSRNTVNALADALNQALPCVAASSWSPCSAERVPILDTVLVEGHTDKQTYRRAGGAADPRDPNDELSTRRALTVFAALFRQHPTMEGLSNSDGLKLLAFSGYGSRRPLQDALSDSADDFQRNRRIDIRFVLSTHTSVELQKLRDQIRRALEGAAP